MYASFKMNRERAGLINRSGTGKSHGEKEINTRRGRDLEKIDRLAEPKPEVRGKAVIAAYITRKTVLA